VHYFPIDHIGYPGYLDYFPGYLDATQVNCMNDRGWSYEATAFLPVSNDKNPHQYLAGSQIDQMIPTQGTQ